MPKKKPSERMNKKQKEHDFVGAGIFTFCRICREFLLDLGIPQKPCKGKFV